MQDIKDAGHEKDGEETVGMNFPKQVGAETGQ